MYDVIVIGCGPAGISSSIYARRANLNTLVIYNGMGSLEYAEKIENYYGLASPVSGKQLFEIGVGQAKALGVELIRGEAIGIQQDEHFAVSTDSGSYEGRAVILALGKARNRAQIAGIDNFLGGGVGMCAVCDGFFYRGKSVAVLGSGNYAVSEVNELLHFTTDITLLTDGQPFSATLPLPDGVQVIADKLTSVEAGTERRLKVNTTSDSYEFDGMFLAAGTASAANFATKLGIITEKNDIVVDEKGMTNVPGVFAAGDCTGGLLQVAKAVADGAIAGRGAVAYLASKK